MVWILDSPAPTTKGQALREVGGQQLRFAFLSCKGFCQKQVHLGSLGVSKGGVFVRGANLNNSGGRARRLQ